jgi:hypothetical protein
MSRIKLGGLVAAALALLVVAAASAAPPAVTTDPASSLGPTKARLHGAVNPGGHDTTWYFQLGTTTGYGTNTAAQHTGAGTKPVNVAMSVNGLAPGTTYDFRLVASNSAGTTFGANQTFVTLAPPAVQTQAVQSVATTSATPMGAVNPNGLATSWWFEYGPTTSYGAKTPVESIGSGTAAIGVSAPLANLAAGTTYHYRLVASNSAGTNYGGDLSFVTAPALTLKAHAFDVVHGNQIELSGTVSSGTSGVAVTVAAEPYGSSAFTPVGTTLTRNGGTFVFYAKPGIGTTYQASVNGGVSQTVPVGVHPSISLTALRLARLKVHVSAGIQLIGRQVQLQRLQSGRWVTLKHYKLDTGSNVTFSASALPHGHSTIRIALSVNEAGPGLLAGFSRELGYRRR